jgi:hypothetical protein
MIEILENGLDDVTSSSAVEVRRKYRISAIESISKRPMTVSGTFMA